jgi:putative component of toxin-antitoxin plasmid stabilization module
MLKCTNEFSEWLDSLDRSLAIRIDQRLQRLIDGNPGLCRRFDNILEIKWKTGAMGSFRLYCCDLSGTIVLLAAIKISRVKISHRQKNYLKE